MCKKVVFTFKNGRTYDYWTDVVDVVGVMIKWFDKTQKMVTLQNDYIIELSMIEKIEVID